MTRNWGASALVRSARTAPDWGTKPVQYLNEYEWLAALWGDWSIGTTIDSRVSLVAGERLGVIAPAFMPYPITGWGFTADAASVIGATDEPQSTSILTTAGTLLSTDNPPTAGTLQRLLDARTTSVLRPTFSRIAP
tara:strand:- start:8938 stop:9345 length:408 start_codon:yes stop_codon:yes gene_type:complete